MMAKCAYVRAYVYVRLHCAPKHSLSLFQTWGDGNHDHVRTYPHTPAILRFMYVRRVLSLHTSIFAEVIFCHLFLKSITMARSRSRSPPASSLPAIPRAGQIVATQKKVVTFYADGTRKVVVGKKRQVCKKWVGFSGNGRRKKCYATGSTWTEGMCKRHAKLNGCQPPQKKPKTLRNGPAESDACKIRDDDKVGLEGVVVKDDE